MRANKTMKKVRGWRERSMMQTPVGIARDLAAHYRQAERRFPSRNRNQAATLPRGSQRERRQG